MATRALAALVGLLTAVALAVGLGWAPVAAQTSPPPPPSTTTTTVDPAAVAAQAAAAITLPTPTVGTNPPPAQAQLTNLPTWLWIEPTANTEGR